jgi:hypothetical protein
MEDLFESDEDEISVIILIKEDYPKQTGYLQVVPCTQIVNLKTFKSLTLTFNMILHYFNVEEFSEMK